MNSAKRKATCYHKASKGGKCVFDKLDPINNAVLSTCSVPGSRRECSSNHVPSLGDDILIQGWSRCRQWVLLTPWPLVLPLSLLASKILKHWSSSGSELYQAPSTIFCTFHHMAILSHPISPFPPFTYQILLITLYLRSRFTF